MYNIYNIMYNITMLQTQAHAVPVRHRFFFRLDPQLEYYPSQLEHWKPHSPPPRGSAPRVGGCGACECRGLHEGGLPTAHRQPHVGHAEIRDYGKGACQVHNMT